MWLLGTCASICISSASLSTRILPFHSLHSSLAHAIRSRRPNRRLRRMFSLEHASCLPLPTSLEELAPGRSGTQGLGLPNQAPTLTMTHLLSYSLATTMHRVVASPLDPMKQLSTRTSGIIFSLGLTVIHSLYFASYAMETPRSVREMCQMIMGFDLFSAWEFFKLRDCHELQVLVRMVCPSTGHSSPGLTSAS